MKKEVKQKICPLMSCRVDTDTYIGCETTNCQFWNGKNNECGIVVAMNMLKVDSTGLASYVYYSK